MVPLKQSDAWVHSGKRLGDSQCIVRGSVIAKDAFPIDKRLPTQGFKGCGQCPLRVVDGHQYRNRSHMLRLARKPRAGFCDAIDDQLRSRSVGRRVTSAPHSARSRGWQPAQVAFIKRSLASLNETQMHREHQESDQAEVEQSHRESLGSRDLKVTAFEGTFLSE